LTTIVDQVEAVRILPILSTVPPRHDDFSDQLNVEFNAAVTSPARQRSLPLIDFYQEILLCRPSTTWINTLISNDGVHPTANGAGFISASNSYVPGGNAATHTTAAWVSGSLPHDA
jgi:lysophospholipase L1-like esterase